MARLSLSLNLHFQLSINATKNSIQNQIMAAPHLLKQALLLRACFHSIKHFTVRAVAARPRLWCSAAIIPPSEKPHDRLNSVNNTLNLRRGDYSSSSLQLEDEPEYRRWKDKEDEILNDIEPILLLTKEILHSPR